MSEETSDSRIPPPAFPPGSRKHIRRNSTPPTPSAMSEGSEATFIQPDDPLPTREDALDRAFISPDDPMPERADRMEGALISPDEPIPERHLDLTDWEEGVVTGMDHDAHVEHEELVTGGDPHVIELLEAVSKLAEALRSRGEAGLKATPEMGRLEATLRSYCVGYLAGRRAEDEVDVVIE